MFQPISVLTYYRQSGGAVDRLEEDTGLQPTNIACLAADRQLWSGIVAGCLTEDD